MRDEPEESVAFLFVYLTLCRIIHGDRPVSVKMGPLFWLPKNRDWLTEKSAVITNTLAGCVL